MTATASAERLTHPQAPSAADDRPEDVVGFEHQPAKDENGAGRMAEGEDIVLIECPALANRVVHGTHEGHILSIWCALSVGVLPAHEPACLAVTDVLVALHEHTEIL